MLLTRKRDHKRHHNVMNIADKIRIQLVCEFSSDVRHFVMMFVATLFV